MSGMFGFGRPSGELSLGAALRDVKSDKPDVRGLAIRSLAPALLGELNLRAPVWWTRSEHHRRDAVVEALDRACADRAPQNAAMARIGLAQLCAPQAYARAREALEQPAGPEHGGDDAAMLMRECGVIALSLLGAAAQAYLDEPDAAEDSEGRATAAELRERILAELRALLDDPRDDVRFQLGPALVEVGGPEVEPDLLAALEREAHPEVRENLIAAISMMDPPSPAACDLLATVVESDEGKGPLGWEAALALTAARRPEGASRLLAGLSSRETRDRALEALAVVAEQADAEAIAAVRRYTKGFLVPVFTKVRAAYALARMVPDEGQALLDRLARHPRPAVREAVAEARQHLIELDEQGDATDRDAYRRT